MDRHPLLYRCLIYDILSYIKTYTARSISNEQYFLVNPFFVFSTLIFFRVISFQMNTVSWNDTDSAYVVVDTSVSAFYV